MSFFLTQIKMTDNNKLNLYYCILVFLFHQRYQYWWSMYVQWPRGYLRHIGSKDAEETVLQMPT